MIIATKLVKKRSVLHVATCLLRSPMPIPITPRGGTRDAAIATPASPAAIFLKPKARNAIRPDANAIPRSIIVGSILIRISLVSCVKGNNRVMTTAAATLTTKLNINNQSHLKNSLLFPVVVANATA